MPRGIRAACIPATAPLSLSPQIRFPRPHSKKASSAFKALKTVRSSRERHRLSAPCTCTGRALLGTPTALARAPRLQAPLPQGRYTQPRHGRQFAYCRLYLFVTLSHCHANPFRLLRACSFGPDRHTVSSCFQSPPADLQPPAGATRDKQITSAALPGLQDCRRIR